MKSCTTFASTTSWCPSCSQVYVQPAAGTVVGPRMEPPHFGDSSVTLHHNRGCCLACQEADDFQGQWRENLSRRYSSVINSSLSNWSEPNSFVRVIGLVLCSSCTKLVGGKLTQDVLLVGDGVRDKYKRLVYNSITWSDQNMKIKTCSKIAESEIKEHIDSMLT